MLFLKSSHSCGTIRRPCGAMTSENAGRLFGLLLLFTTVLFLYVLVLRPKTLERNTVATWLESALMLMQNNHLHPDDLKQLSEMSDEMKLNVMNTLRQAIGKMFNRCKENIRRCQKSSDRKNKLLTLFTTWPLDQDKLFINNRTLFNWRTLPETNRIVFSNSTAVKYYSRQAGFEVLPIIDEAAGAPVLPAMFAVVKQKFKSEFYGFANGDILFTNSLVETLESIRCKLDRSTMTKGLLIVGRRMNIPSSVLTDDIVTSWSQLERVATEVGELFLTVAEDYFITDSQYPWETFLPVAVGRIGYDNWVVAYSRYRNITVIDVTESVFCLHQTLESRGNFEGHTKGEYNINLMEKVDVPFDFRTWGQTACASLKTWTDLCGNIVVSKRKKIRKECTEYH